MILLGILSLESLGERNNHSAHCCITSTYLPTPHLSERGREGEKEGERESEIESKRARERERESENERARESERTSERARERESEGESERARERERETERPRDRESEIDRARERASETRESERARLHHRVAGKTPELHRVDRPHGERVGERASETLAPLRGQAVRWAFLRQAITSAKVKLTFCQIDFWRS